MHIPHPWLRLDLILPDLVCILVCLAGAVTDLRTRRIPNWLTFPAIVVGLILNTALPSAFHGPVEGFISALVGALLLLLVFGFLGLINFLGMGDVKLMTAVGALLRWPTALWAMVYVSLAGGAFALVYALFGGHMGDVLRNVLTIGRRVVKRKAASEQPKPQLHRIPYAVPILIGAIWAAAVKYFPGLRLG